MSFNRLFETGTCYRCSQDTHLVDYKLIKKRAGYRMVQRAILVKKGEIILCLKFEEKDGQGSAVFLFREEMINIQEHCSTLKAFRKDLIKIGQ